MDNIPSTSKCYFLLTCLDDAIIFARAVEKHLATYGLYKDHCEKQAGHCTEEMLLINDCINFLIFVMQLGVRGILTKAANDTIC